jgi:glycosyltransferase involved in cell wall biosynthesis
MVPRAQPRTDPLTVAVLEPGRENSGIRRYSEIVSDGLAGLGDVSTSGVAFTPKRRGWRGVLDAVTVVRRCRHADAAIIPYTRSNVWAPSIVRLLQIVIVHLALRRRTVTVLHDIYAPGGPNRVEWWVLTAVLLLSGRVVLHTDHERSQLSAVPGSRRAEVVPHFVLEREHLPEPAVAREQLGIGAGTTVLAMIGWMNPRKNYELAIDTLALLPSRFVLWLVGGAGLGLDWYVEQLEARIAERGLDRRVVITGALSERDLERHLAALDIGLCPYQRISASGSVSTLLGARRPVVVTDVEFARELKTLAPAAVHLLGALGPQALSEAIAGAAESGTAPEAFDALLRSRSLAEIARRYREGLEAVAGRA